MRVTRSAFERNAVGVRAYGSGTTDVEGSLFFRNGVGILGQDPDGSLTEADVSLTGNTFTRNGDGIYLNLPQPGDSLFPARGSVTTPHSGTRGTGSTRQRRKISAGTRASRTAGRLWAWPAESRAPDRAQEDDSSDGMDVTPGGGC